MRKSVSILLAMLLAVGVVPSAGAFTIEVIPQSSGAALGSTFTVDVVASDLGEGVAPSIGSFDLDVSFDPEILSVSGVTFGSGLSVGGFGSLTDLNVATPGRVNAFEVSFDSDEDLNNLQPGAFTLFTIAFNANSIGTSAFGLFVNAIATAEGLSLVPDVLNEASVSVTPVPLPAAAWLLLSGLAGAGYVFRGGRGSAREQALAPHK